MLLPKAEWSITGLIIEHGVKRSKNNPDWSQPFVKLQTMGDTYDVSLEPDLHGRCGQGQMVRMKGRFERRSGKEGGTYTNFVGESFAVIDQATGKEVAA